MYNQLLTVAALHTWIMLCLEANSTKYIYYVINILGVFTGSERMTTLTHIRIEERQCWFDYKAELP